MTNNLGKVFSFPVNSAFLIDYFVCKWVINLFYVTIEDNEETTTFRKFLYN